MITTKELNKWEQRARENMLVAMTGIDKYKYVPTMRDYYEHLAQTADAQISILQRLIRQSEANNEENKRKN